VADGLNVVTGANGLVGSHIVERLLAAGERARAVVRPGGDSSFVKGLGAETVAADLGDVPALRQAVHGAKVVYHCAARVSDWGRWPDFEADTVQGTRNTLEACRAEGVGRVLYLSSVAVYGQKVEGQTVTEEVPLASPHSLWRWDHYSRSKVLAEEVVRQYGPLVTVVRPSWCFGPRDRLGLPRVIHNLRRGWASVIGTGDNPINLIHARDLADGAVRAANHPQAAGEAFNLTGVNGEVTQAQFLGALTDALGLPRLTSHVSFATAVRGALLVEIIGRLIRKRTPPRYTRRAVYRIAWPVHYSTEKARAQLGWRPAVGFAEGIKETLDWVLGQP
jgi:nucleoside-diphosphate-sugar epimerase